MRIRVFFPFVVTSIILSLLDGGMITLFMLIGESEQFDLLFWLLISVFAIIIPIILLISSIFAMGNVIEFDETGVRRIRFGRVIRNFSWEKVKTVSCTSTDSWTGWVYISEHEKKYDGGFFSIDKMRLDRQVIYFHMSQKAKKALQKYAPPSLKAPWMVKEGK